MILLLIIYHSFKFCLLNDSLSSILQHNCLTCNEGFLRSYEFMGNCYKIEYPNNNSNIYKIIKNKNEENYTLINSCLDENKNYTIIPIGECVSKCPNETAFHTYTYNYQNFSNQEESVIPQIYPLSLEKAPKYLFNNLCY